MSKFVEKIAEWMPLRLQIWRKGTAFFSPAERGAYMDLILAYWELGPLPAEDDVLQQLARVPDHRLWKQVRGKVLAKFHERDGFLYHARIDEERTVAVQKYERRAHAGSAGGKASVEAKAKQTPSNASSNASPDVEAKPQAPANTTYQEHSPDGETLANASVTRKPRKARRTRLADDWKPSEADHAYARTVGLTDAEIDAAGAEFSRYWRSADAAGGGLKADWHTTWCANIDRNAAAIIGRRPRPGKPGQHGSRAGSVVDVVTRLKARADLGGQDDGTRMGGGGDELSPAEPYPANTSTGDLHGGEIIDAGECERMYRPTRRTEASDRAANGGDGEPGSPTDAVCEEAPGLSGGRSAEGSDDATEHQQMVAGVVGVEGEAGSFELQAPPSSGGLEEWEIIPEFLRRN